MHYPNQNTMNSLLVQMDVAHVWSLGICLILNSNPNADQKYLDHRVSLEKNTLKEKKLKVLCNTRGCTIVT